MNDVYNSVDSSHSCHHTPLELDVDSSEEFEQDQSTDDDEQQSLSCTCNQEPCICTHFPEQHSSLSSSTTSSVSSFPSVSHDRSKRKILSSHEADSIHLALKDALVHIFQTVDVDKKGEITQQQFMAFLKTLQLTVKHEHKLVAFGCLLRVVSEPCSRLHIICFICVLI